VAGCCECGDEPSGSCATELVRRRGMAIYPLKIYYFRKFKYQSVTLYFYYPFQHFGSVRNNNVKIMSHFNEFEADEIITTLLESLHKSYMLVIYRPMY
jgi:hypothetical protein